MKKLAVFTIAIGNLYERILDISRPTLETYANRVGADLIIDGENGKKSPKGSLPHYRKLKIGSLLRQYHRVLYVDADIVIHPEAPNIFKVVPANSLGLFEEGKYLARRRAMRQFLKHCNFESEKWDGRYYNTGVIVASRRHSSIFQTPEVEVNHFYEQTYLNALFAFHEAPVFELDWKWNLMPFLCERNNICPEDGYFAHHAGDNPNFNQEARMERMRYSVRTWDFQNIYKSFTAEKLGAGL